MLDLMKNFTTLILAGGIGTRLASLYPDLPKPLVPVSGQPFLHWLI
ncbi:MAG: sugar phosphate nucleotidyltransferase, partial [Alphaproteobacteria bacterium]